MRHLLWAALCAAWALPSAHAASPSVAAMLLDEGDTVTLIETYTVSAETLERLALPELPATARSPEVLALRLRSMEQWADVQATLDAAGHAPVRHSLQRADGDTLTTVGPVPLAPGSYLLQATTPAGATLQRTLDLRPGSDGLSIR